MAVVEDAAVAVVDRGVRDGDDDRDSHDRDNGRGRGQMSRQDRHQRHAVH